MYNTIKAILYRNKIISKSFLAEIILVAYLLISYYVNKDTNFIFNAIIIYMVIFMFFIKQVNTLVIHDKAVKFKGIYRIMGLNPFGYTLTNILYFTLKFYLGALFMMGINLLLLRMSNKQATYEIIRMHYFPLMFLTLIFCFQCAILGVFTSFNFHKQQLAHTISGIICYIILILNFQNSFQEITWTSFLIPLNGFVFYFIKLIENVMYDSKGDIDWIFPSIVLLINSFLWIAVTFYLDQIYPSEDQSHKKWYFFMDIFKKKEPINQNDLEMDLIEMDLQGLCITKMNKFFGKFQALKDINMKISNGETVAILGHNGAGKSTLINIITGIYSESSGTIYYQGQKFQAFIDNNQFQVSVCPAYDIYFDEMTVKEHLVLISILRRTQEYEEKIKKISQQLELQQFMDYKASTLSGGYKRRLNLAIALFDEPHFLFLDEPTSSVDPSSRKQIWKLLLNIKNQRKETITFLSSHHLEEAELLADRIQVLVKGEIYASGSIAELKQKFGAGYEIECYFKKESVENLTFFQVLKQDLENQFRNLQFIENDLIHYTNRKMNIIIPALNSSCIDQILQTIEQQKKQDLQIQINSNSLEEIYMKIENLANKNQLDESSIQIANILRNLFINDKQFVSQFKIFGIMILQNCQYLFLNIQFAIMCINILIFSFFPLIYMTFQKETKMFNKQILNSLFFAIIFSDLAFMASLPYKLIVERCNNIRQVLLSNRVFYFNYYFCDILIHLLIHFTGLFVLYLGIQHYGVSDLSNNQVIYYLYIIALKKMSYIGFGCAIQFLFEQPQKIYTLLTLLNIAILIIVSILSDIFSITIVEYLSDTYIALKFLYSDQIQYLLSSLVFGFHFIMYMSIVYIVEVYNSNFNYNNPSEIQSNPIQVNNELSKTVEEERKITYENNRHFKALSLYKEYNKVNVVKDITFGIDKQSNVGFLGPNGAGKSTTINMMINRVKKSFGKLKFENMEQKQGLASTLNEFNQIYLYNQFGIVNQSNQIWENFYVKQIFNLFIRLNNIQQKPFEQLLEFFEFNYYLDKKVEELSSGNQRKLCIIISLLNNPNIFIYDEATCGVDLIMKRKLKFLLDYFKTNRQSIGLFTTHFLEDINLFCDKLILIKNGQLLYADFIDNLKSLVGGYVLKLNFKETTDGFEERFEIFAEQLKKYCQINSQHLIENQFSTNQYIISLSKITHYSQIMKILINGEERQEYNSFTIRQKSIEDIYLELMDFKTDQFNLLQ